MKFRFFTNRAQWSVLAVLMIAGLLLSACGADATPTTAPAAATPTTAAMTEPTATTAMTADTPTTAMAGTTPTTAAAGGAATATGAPPAPTNTTVVVGGGASLSLNGAGATFPVPIYTKWFQVYSTSVDKNVGFNYQPLGSGAGITAITNKTVEFAGSDAPLTDAQMQAAPALIHIPTVAGAVVLAYNVKGVASGLVLDGPTAAGIFNGDITSWNDPKIMALNPGLTLPSADIAVVHRSDGSGTTNIFTSYLSAVSPDWSSKVGKGTTVNWPVGLGGRGNPGVAGLVQQTDGAIGYVELAYATQNKIAYAKMKNAAGQVVDATIDSTNAAVKSMQIPPDFRIQIGNPTDPAAWPIAGFTYLLVYKDLNNIKDQAKAQALMTYIWWAEHDGQQYAKDLVYASPGSDMQKSIETELKSVTFNGSPVLK